MFVPHWPVSGHPPDLDTGCGRLGLRCEGQSPPGIPSGLLFLTWPNAWPASSGSCLLAPSPGRNPGHRDVQRQRHIQATVNPFHRRTASAKVLPAIRAPQNGREPAGILAHLPNATLHRRLVRTAHGYNCSARTAIDRSSISLQPSGGHYPLFLRPGTVHPTSSVVGRVAPVSREATRFRLRCSGYH